MNASDRSRLVLVFLLVVLAACSDEGAGNATGGDVPDAQRQQESVQVAPREAGARTVGLNEVVLDFAFTDIDGVDRRLSGVAVDRPLVITMRDTSCPVCQKQRPELARVVKDYADRVGFLFVSVVETDGVEELKADRRVLGENTIFVRDPDHRIARRLAATSTAETFLLDADRRMVFRGALDDQYGLNYTKKDAGERYLRSALDDLLAGRAVKVAATTAPGCMLDIPESTASAVPTFHRDISPILQRSCQRCHRPGGNSPFPLETYAQARAKRGMIRYVLKQGTMPPWHAAPGVGGPWANDMRMHDSDRAILKQWLEGGCPEGDAAEAPKPMKWPQGWTIGEPDLVLKTRPMKIPAEGLVDYFHELIPTSFPKDRWIQRMELRSSQPEALHHILVFEFTDARKDWNINLFGRLALEEFFMIYAPGADPIVYPEDRAKKLSKGMGLMFQVHYVATGKPLEDVVELGIVFADEPPQYPVLCDAASSAAIDVGPGESGVRVPGYFQMPADGLILGFVPHMHLRGSAFEMALIDESETTELLSVPRFDFNWQQAYRLVEPLRVRKGATIRAIGTFDNSDATNEYLTPAQAKMRVRFGPYTDDEMMIGYFEWVRLD